MRLDAKDMARLWDMLDAARAIMQFIHNQSFQDYLANRMMRGAVERHFEIIGEAARQLSEDARAYFPDIPWLSVIGLRNIIAHEYGDILHEKVWNVCINRLPALIEQLESAGTDDKPPFE